MLLGDREPKGRLPITIPMRDEDIPGWGVGLGQDKTLDYDASEPTGYRHARRHGIAPRYPFGFGLGYTTFELVDARVSDAGAATDLVTVTATVRNTGDRAGRDVIQAYVQAPGEIDCRLAGYGAIELAGGESGTVTFTLDAQAFRRWDEAAGQLVRSAGQPPGADRPVQRRPARDRRSAAMIKTQAPVLREPKQERSRRSFERVQDAALALLVERGPDAFTLAEVCTRADASMGAIYNRVNGKDDLIRLIHEREMARVDSDTEKALQAIDLQGGRASRCSSPS